MTAGDTSPLVDPSARLRLDGRAYVVLGAGQGIGRQTTGAVAALGGQVLCVDVDRDRAHEIAEEVGGVPHHADITDRSEMEAVFAAADASFGRLDGVADIVGIAGWGPLSEVTDADWQRAHDLCLRHALLAIQLGAPLIARSGGGSMVFVSSVSGLSGAPMHGAYGAAKAGLMALTKTAAIEYAPSHVRVNTVSPGNVLTPRAMTMMDEATRTARAEAIPLGRLVEPSEIAATIAFLLSDLASMITGQNLIVDGGVAAKFQYRG